MNKIINGDCIEVLKTLPDNSVDAVITDPPYELGFMGKSWDSTGIANSVELWSECLRVLKPGGHLLSFAATRTYHRMTCAIEDAGFEIRDMIEWVYGSGFPKSMNIGKAVDKLQGNEREEKEEEHWGRSNRSYQTGHHSQVHKNNIDGIESIKKDKRIITKGTSEWEGWGTALKPSHEPICMARKPLSEKTIALNCLKWGTGGINIDESRVGTGDDRVGGGLAKDNFGINGMPQTERPTGARFPANLILGADEDGQVSEEIRECFPETKSQSGGNRGKSQIWGGANGEQERNGFDDQGNASRFFKSIPLWEEEIEYKSLIYQAKASKSERNKGMPEGETNTHCTVKPVALISYLINMVTREGQTVLDPFAGSGTTGIACKNLNRDYILIEREEEYITIIEARLGIENVKPAELKNI